MYIVDPIHDICLDSVMGEGRGVEESGGEWRRVEESGGYGGGFSIFLI